MAGTMHKDFPEEALIDELEKRGFGRLDRRRHRGAAAVG